MLSGITWLIGNNKSFGQSLRKNTYFIFQTVLLGNKNTAISPENRFLPPFYARKNVMPCQKLSFEHTDCNTPEIHLLPSNGFLKRCFSLCLKASNLFIDVKQTEKGSSDLARYQPPHPVRRALVLFGPYSRINLLLLIQKLKNTTWFRANEAP